jgi:hypothetical protein
VSLLTCEQLIDVTLTLLVKIRKSSQSALIRLFEYEQVKSEDIEEEIIPALCQLDRACDDFKNESILVGELFSLSSVVDQLDGSVEHRHHSSSSLSL